MTRTILGLLLAFVLYPPALEAQVTKKGRAADPVASEDGLPPGSTRILGGRDHPFSDIGPKRGLLVGLDVFLGKFFDNDVVHGVRPYYLDGQGRVVPGSLSGKDTGRVKPLRAKKGFAIGALSVHTGLGIDGISATYMKYEKGMLDVARSEESDYVGGPGGGTGRVGGTGEVAIGIVGSQNTNRELNGIGLVLSDKPVLLAPPSKRTPVPAEAAQAKALKLAKEVYGDEWAAAKTPEQRRALAKKILQGAEETGNDPAGRFVLLKLAKDVATQGAEGRIAFEAIDKLGEQFQVDEVDMKYVVLGAFAKRAKLPLEHKSIADEAAGLIDAAIAHDNFDLANKLGEMAMPEARAAHDMEQFREIKAKLDQIKPLVKAYQEMKAAAAVLDKTPDDPAANLAVGRYTCFVKGDWDKGLPMLALGSDEKLKAVAVKELAGAEKPDAQMRIGDQWWELADQEPAKAQKLIRGRANFWYEKAAPELAGLAKGKVEKRMKEYEALAEGGDKRPEAGDAAGKAPARFRPGLLCKLYVDASFATPVKARIDKTIDFDWGYQSPDPAIRNGEYGVYWAGFLKVPKNGRYAFGIRSGGGVRVVIDNVPVFDALVADREIERRVDVPLKAGYRQVSVQLLRKYSKGYCQFSWQPPGAVNSSVIPAEYLFHDAKQEPGGK